MNGNCAMKYSEISEKIPINISTKMNKRKESFIFLSTKEQMLEPTNKPNRNVDKTIAKS